MTNHLPPGWAWAELGDLVTVLDRMRVPLNKAEREKRLGSVPYYGATGPVDWIDEALFDEELLLLGEDGAPFLDPNKRKSYIIRGPSWVNNHAHVLRALGDLTTSYYLKHYLDFIDYGPHVTGTTRLKLTQRAMRSIPIGIPSVAEQERIVAAIEEHFARLDAVEATLQMGLQRLVTLKSAVLVEAFHSNRGLPSHRNWATLGDIAEVRGGIQKQPKRRPNEHPAPFLRVANVLRGELRLDEVHQIELFDGELEKYRLHVGDLLVVEGNGSPQQIGRAACWEGEIADCVHQNHLIRVRPGPSLVPRYLALYWNAPHTASVLRDVASSTSGLYTLSTAKVKSIPVPLAPLPEQRRIADEVDQHLETYSRLERSIQRALSRLRSVRRSVLAMAFSGQLVPQDPNDEPASVLLDRIATSRQTTPILRSVSA